MFDCTKRRSNEGVSNTTDWSPKVGACWKSDLASVKLEVATLAANSEAVQGALKGLESVGIAKQDLQTLTQNLQVIRDDMHKLEKQYIEFRREMKCDIAQRLQRLEDRHTSLQGQQLAMLALLGPGGQTVTTASLEVVREVNGLQKGGPAEGLKELEEKINSCLITFEQRLSQVEEKRIIQSKLREEREGLAEVNDSAFRDVLAEQGQKENDKNLQELARGDHANIDPATHDDSTRIVRHLEFEFENNIWDLAVFAFTRQMSLGSSIVIVVCLILNMLLLVFFAEQVALLIQDKMKAFDEHSQAEFHFWRVTAGHSVEYQNPVTGASMVSSVCNAHRFIPQSNLQLDLADQLALYLDEGNMSAPAGQFMCMLSLIVWYLALIEELRSILAVLRMSFNVPVGFTTRFEQDQTDSSKVNLVSMSRGRRLLLAGILFARVVVVGLLGWEGTLFLISEIQAENMILNSLALQIMLNFDEMLVALLPKIPQAITRYILPVPIRVKCSWWDSWGLFIALSCALTALLALAQIVYMNPFLEDLRASYDKLCGGVSGSWDFVVGVDEIGIPWAAPAPPSQRDVLHGYYEKVIEIAKDSGFPHLNLRSGQRGNTGPFMQVASGAALKRIIVDRPEFRDPREWQLFDPFRNSDDIVGWPSEKVEVLGFKDFADQPGTVYNNYLKFLLGLEGNVSCAQVPLRECVRPGTVRPGSAASTVFLRNALLFRKLCPGRCGCDSPTVRTIANSYSGSSDGFIGCPSWSTRRKAFVEALQVLPCTDTKDRTQMALWADGVGDVVLHSSGNMLANHVLSIFDSGGCPGVVRIEFDSRLCHQTSLPSICPESCGCNTSQPWTSSQTSRTEYCPYSCDRTESLCMTVAIDYPARFDDTGSRGPFAGIACAFPFKYKGKTYRACTYDDWHGPWCAVTLHDGASEFWGDCPETFACVGPQVQTSS